jgi:hypothetical protein
MRTMVTVLGAVLFSGVVAGGALAACQPAADCAGNTATVCQGGCSDAGCGYISIDASGEVCVCSADECVVGG